MPLRILIDNSGQEIPVPSDIRRQALEMILPQRAAMEEESKTNKKDRRWFDEKGQPYHHPYVAALEYCGWLPNKRIKIPGKRRKQSIRKMVQSCYPDCCFNHKVGLPRKEVENKETGEITYSDPMPLTKYEKRVIEKYESNRKYGQNKCRGGGITEILAVRHMAFKYAVLNIIVGRKCVVCAGNGLGLSLEIMHRIKQILDKIPYVYKKIPTAEKPEELWFRSQGRVIAIAAEFLALAGLENVGDIIGDEITKWKLVDDKPVLKTLLPYVAKSKANLALFGTPMGQRGFAYELIFNPELANTAGFFVQILNWREVVGIPAQEPDEAELMAILPRPVIKQVYREKYKTDLEYKKWFDEFFKGVTLEEVLDVDFYLLDVKEIARLAREEPDTYAQELDNQHILPSGSLYGKFFARGEFEAEEI